MRINNRERNLLVLLILFVASWLTFDLIIEDQFKVLADQKIELKLMEAELTRYNHLLDNEQTIDKSIEEQYEVIHDVAKAYFNTTPQEEQLLLLNDFLSMPFVEGKAINFIESELVEAGDVRFMRDRAIIEVAGQYEPIINMLKTVWAFPKKINVAEISIREIGFDEVKATISLDFYTFAATSGMVDDLYKWYVDELFHKDNPFAAVVENETVVRYLYLPDDTLFNYSKYFEFKDIEGHWNQSEIEEFLSEGYLYLNPYLEFGPDEPITRGEFVVLLDAYYEWPTIYDSEYDLTDFRDYEDLGSLESSFAKAIHKGYLSGIVEGYTDRTLRPRDSISYEEVEFLMNKIKGTDDFSWVTIGNSIARSKGIRNNSWSDPKGEMSRAEAVYLLYYFE